MPSGAYFFALPPLRRPGFTRIPRQSRLGAARPLQKTELLCMQFFAKKC